MICVIEVGTSRSRVRLADDMGQIIVEDIQIIGAQDVAIVGDNKKLKSKLRNMIQNLLKKEKLSFDTISDVVAHGMATSDIGLFKVEHISAPADIDKLASQAVWKKIPEIIDKQILLIPGVKNYVDDITINNLNSTDFMRGEETQIIGIIHSIDMMKNLQFPFYFLMLSSFTKLVYINSNRQIDIATTNVTGQLFPAIMKETFLAGMLPNDFPSPETMNKNLVLEGYKYVEKVGFPRALMLIRLGQYFLKMSKDDAMSFLEGIIAYLDISRMIQHFISNNINIVVSGDPYRRKVYSFLIREHHGFAGNIISIEDGEMNELTVKGALEILKWARKYKV